MVPDADQNRRVPAYHWCPGDFWHPEWGNNWEGGNCHDDFHRDIDGNDHSRDWGQQQQQQQQPWLPWQQH